MSPLLIATAFNAEYQAIWELLGKRSALVTKGQAAYAVTGGTLAGLNVELLMTGTGRAAVEKNLSDYLKKSQPAGVLSLGFCGGLSHSAKIGTVSVPDSCILESQGSFSPSLPLRQRVVKKFFDDDLEFLVGDMLTTERAIRSNDEKKALNAVSGAVTVDMESAFFARVCKEAEIPWFVLKTVMDDLTTKNFSKKELKPGMEIAKGELLKVLPKLLEELRQEWQL